jgi:hypothetical protein
MTVGSEGGLVLPLCAVVHALAGLRSGRKALAEMLLRIRGHSVMVLGKEERSVQCLSQSLDSHGLPVVAAELNNDTGANASVGTSSGLCHCGTFR